MTRKMAYSCLFRYDDGTMPKPSKVGRGPKIKTSIYLNKERLAALKTISNSTLIPMSALIRKGVDMVITEYTKSKR